MALPKPRLLADEQGIWCEDQPGRRFGIAWDDVAQVSGHKIDGKSVVFTCVVLDYEFGEFFEMFADMPGFAEVTVAMGQRLDGLDPDWLTKIEQLGIDDPPLVVWNRAK